MSFETFDDIYPTIKGLSLAGERIDKITGVYYEASSVSAENATEMTGDNHRIALSLSKAKHRNDRKIFFTKGLIM